VTDQPKQQVKVNVAVSKHCRRRIWLTLGFTFLFAVALGFSYEQIGRWRDSRHPFRVGRAIDVGGRTLNIDCAGSGTPAVILESGGGGRGGYGWRKVQAGVAQFTTVCWYDRAGEGWSDPAPSARNSDSVVFDLHNVLQRAPIPGPYVLVGHSVGGEYVRVYASRFPSEVAGLVLVDSSHPDQREPPAMLSPINRLPKVARQLLCFVMPIMARVGVVRVAMRNVPVYVPTSFSGESRTAEQAIRSQRVKALETEEAQECAATKGGAVLPDRGTGNPELDGAARSAGRLGDRPLIVLTAGLYWKPDDPIVAKQIADFHEIWMHQLQSELAHLSTNGKQIIVENSDHGIPEQAPDSVINAVHEIVAQIRNSRDQ
jgi:pimeloyl-ACP methyl ester carboxylesterase